MKPEVQDKLLPARIIPVAGIKGRKEQEQRATSALLSVIEAVPPFGKDLLSDLGAPRGTVRSYVEVPLQTEARRTIYPDGAIVAQRGKRKWSSLVEVKTGDSDIDPEQITAYLGLARQHGLDGVLLISNHIMGGPHEVPVELPKKTLKNVQLWQLSWWRILTAAIMHYRHEGVDDPTQAWILGELIAYLTHPNSGAGDFTDMGQSWVPVREGARHQTLNRRQQEVHDVAWRWEQFVHYVALGLCQDLGVEVSPVERRGQSTRDRVEDTIDQLAHHGRMRGMFRVPDTVGPLQLCADLAARKVDMSVVVDAPEQGRSKTQINWLLRQLRTAPEDLRIEVRFQRKRTTTSALLRDARERSEILLCPDDPAREPREFELTLSAPMSLKKGNRPGSFTEDTRQHVLRFYRDIVQGLTAWRPPAPKLKNTERRDKGSAAGQDGHPTQGEDRPGTSGRYRGAGPEAPTHRPTPPSKPSARTASERVSARG